MISSIKTPGVYINEINGFPPSIAQVATAIPAFIGYTEKGTRNPTKINSLLEYEEIFGTAADPDSITIDLGAEEYKVTESKFKLYNSLRLFYANGGGQCYIVSVNTYNDPVVESDFINGINKLEKFDEPTLLLFPDAVNLTAAQLGSIQKQALIQSAKLMDRFAILDVKQETNLSDDSDNFRNEIGNQNLKYGAAYYPYLKANFGYNFRFMNIQGNGVDFKVQYPDLIADVSNFEALDNDINTLNGAWETAGMKADRLKPATGSVTNETKVQSYVTKCWNILGLLADPTAINNATLETFVNDLIVTSLKPLAQKLFDFEQKFDGLNGITYSPVLDATLDDTFDDATWKGGANFTVSTPNLYDNLVTTNPAPDPDDSVSYPKVEAQLGKLHNDMVNTINGVLGAMANLELQEENNLVSRMPIYPTIISQLSKTMNTVPPSGAIAGIYAQTDATRGVWKAPGNVSVNGVIELADDISHKEQEDMNIHETGKSINAIRKFTGKGLLVWGARTLDGNSNDWRYINVRRLANMIEESSKKACMNFVFEPNVKQTWVNVKGMIENYLTTLWNDGALAGAKPEDAFFVSVGLGATMSANDINEGRMIVKIGYAPSRPAEFIILEFTQTQQKS